MNKIILFGLVLVIGLGFAQSEVPSYMQNQFNRAHCMHDIAWDTLEDDNDVQMYCDDDEECIDYFAGLAENTCEAMSDIEYHTYEETDPQEAAQAFMYMVAAFREFYSEFLMLGFDWALDYENPGKAMGSVISDYRSHMGDLMECYAEGGHDEEVESVSGLHLE